MTSIREEITGKIRDELVAGKFQAGLALRETELAERFGVSRGPIRDAFLQLSQEGFLAYQVNKGVTVRHPLIGEDREFIASIRVQIELYVVGKGFDDLTEESLTLISDCLETLKQACETEEVAAIAKADMAFHEALLIACGGEDHVHYWRQICSRMLLAYTRLGSYQALYQEHVNIYKALKSKMKDVALAAINSNVT
jgi:DNA-binding GntR family transcriptional regulator